MAERRSKEEREGLGVLYALLVLEPWAGSRISGGAHAPPVLAMTPSSSRTFLPRQPSRRVVEVRFPEMPLALLSIQLIQSTRSLIDSNAGYLSISTVS